MPPAHYLHTPEYSNWLFYLLCDITGIEVLTPKKVQKNMEHKESELTVRLEKKLHTLERQLDSIGLSEKTKEETARDWTSSASSSSSTSIGLFRTDNLPADGGTSLPVVRSQLESSLSTFKQGTLPTVMTHFLTCADKNWGDVCRLFL